MQQYKDRFCECSFWIKYSLFIINFLVWVGGVCLMVIGVWARLQKAQLNSVEIGITADPALMLVAVGVIMFVTSIFGCMGSVRENVILLKIFCVVIIIVFILEVIAGILAFVFIDRIEEKLMAYMETAITRYQDRPDLQNAMDYIQKRFECCGSSSYADWDHNVYFNCSSPSALQCSVPLSCCLVRNSVTCGFNTRRHGETYAAAYIYTTGCIGILMSLFKDNLIIVGFIAFAVGFMELIGVVLAHMLIKYIMLARLKVNSPSKSKLYPTKDTLMQYPPPSMVVNTDAQLTHL